LELCCGTALSSYTLWGVLCYFCFFILEGNSADSLELCCGTALSSYTLWGCSLLLLLFILAGNSADSLELCYGTAPSSYTLWGCPVSLHQVPNLSLCMSKIAGQGMPKFLWQCLMELNMLLYALWES
jgi:hypothetical protein